jgi:acid phosphatase (class A)
MKRADALCRRTFRLVLVFALLGATVSSLAADRPPGYLADDELDVTTILEPAPQVGDPRYDTDRKIFRATRSLAGTPRWQMATNDANESTASLLKDFSCSVGVALTPENSPALVRVALRANTDTATRSAKAKEFYKRQRPFLIDKGEICQPRSELFDTKAGRASYDYPSGHTTRGWTWALLLAAIAPGRAEAILRRGRAYGDSRFVCGAHNESAVEAGMLSASSTMSVVSTKPAYQVDIAAARAELVSLRRAGPAPTGCEAETGLLNERVMPKLDRIRRPGTTRP